MNQSEERFYEQAAKDPQTNTDADMLLYNCANEDHMADRCAYCEDCTTKALEMELARGRELGFHEGKEMAILIISNAVTSNSDMPMLALKTAIKALRAKTTNEVA